MVRFVLGVPTGRSVSERNSRDPSLLRPDPVNCPCVPSPGPGPKSRSLSVSPYGSPDVHRGRVESRILPRVEVRDFCNSSPLRRRKKDLSGSYPHPCTQSPTPDPPEGTTGKRNGRQVSTGPSPSSTRPRVSSGGPRGTRRGPCGVDV